jgi:hypothetical protein
VYCDSADSVIRRVLSNGTIETIAGEGIPGYGGDGGTATKALLGSPCWPAYDLGRNLHFADSFTARIRRSDTRGVITTIAGSGIPGGVGDGGLRHKHKSTGRRVSPSSVMVASISLTTNYTG